MNQLRLTATLVAREALRYTPAGVPMMLLECTHRSVQHEAGASRSVELEMAVLAADQLARRFERVGLGTELILEGFLAPRRRNSRALVLHLTGFECRPAAVAPTEQAI